MQGQPGRKPFGLIVALCAAALILACSAFPAMAAGAAGPQIPSSEPAGTLYLLQSANGTLTRVHGRMRLSLAAPNRRVTTFEDRPARRGRAAGGVRPRLATLVRARLRMRR